MTIRETYWLYGRKIHKQFDLVILCAKCGCHRNCPTNKIRSHFPQVGVKTVSKFGWFDNLISNLRVISPGRHKPTAVSARGGCEMSPYYSSAASAERCVVKQAFGKGLEWEWEGRNALNTVERWSGQHMGSCLQRWRYIERLKEDGLNSQEGCGAESALTHRRLWVVLCSYIILLLYAVLLTAAHSPKLEPSEIIFSVSLRLLKYIPTLFLYLNLTRCAVVTVASLWSVFLTTAIWWDKYWGLSY